MKSKFYYRWQSATRYIQVFNQPIDKVYQTTNSRVRRFLIRRKKKIHRLLSRKRTRSFETYELG